MYTVFKSKTYKKELLMAVVLIIIAFLVLIPKLATAQITLDFEDLSAGTKVTTQYSSQGVLFKSAYINTNSAAASGTRVIRAGGEEFHTGPFEINFLNNQTRVRFLAGTDWAGDGTLRAFDANDNLIAQDGPKAVALNAFTTIFEVSVASPAIVRVEFEVGISTFEAIDDLTFYGEVSGQLPTTPPAVQITSPTQNQQFTNRQITLAGTITGEGVVGANYEVRMTQPEESQAPTTTGGTLQLSGSGNQRTFSMSYLVGLGPQTLTVTAENTAGLLHSESVQITYLPQAIRDRIVMEGPSTLGGFLFGGNDKGCSYVVYEQAAISLVGDNTYVVRGEILRKWLSEKDLNGYPNLGCPTSEVYNIPGESILAQGFQKARIYADANGTYKVPTVFVEAMDARDGEKDIGIPMEDPRESTGIMQTWLFQRFRRPGRDTHDATLQIRGQPPKLYIERVANHPEHGIPVSQSPTIVEEFNCSDLLGPCDFNIAEEQPHPDLGRYCNYEKFDWEGVKDALLGTIGVDDIDLDPPEWAPIVNHYAQTSLRGIVTDVEQSPGDNPFTHEFRFDCPPSTIELIANWAAKGEPHFCASDWHLNVEPLPGWRDLIGSGSGSHPSYREKIPVEFERGHARAFSAWGWDSRVGDLLFVSGRWIVDCGHNYKTEIHPPSIVANMRTLPDRPETYAVVWVNGFYSGEPVELDIDPPPRPSPDATLHALRQDAEPGPIDVMISESIINGQHFRLSFSAPPRRVEVTPTGEMKFEPGRDYKGKFWVYWKTKKEIPESNATVTFQNIKRLKRGKREIGTGFAFIFNVNGQQRRFPARGTVNLAVGQSINPNLSITQPNLTSASNLQLIMSARKGRKGFGGARVTYTYDENFGHGENTTFINRRTSTRTPPTPGRTKGKPRAKFENLFEVTYQIDVEEN